VSSHPVRVVKVGGSLLTFSELPRVLNDWLLIQPPTRNVLLAGGGELADVIRTMDGRFHLGEEASHWLCIDVLGVTARLLQTVLPHSHLVSSLADLRQQLASEENSCPIVFDPRDFMQADEPRLDGAALPHSWDATSDSIAARLAVGLSADELVLLKSADPPDEATPGAAYVDTCFAEVASQIPRIRIENLRRFGY
jgi:aspartokinase-like uncharacterized kinase